MLHNAKVYIAARNRENAEIAIQELEAETGKDAVFLELDLANLQSVKRAAAEFLRYVLVTNLSIFQEIIGLDDSPSVGRRTTSMYFSIMRLLFPDS